MNEALDRLRDGAWVTYFVLILLSYFQPCLFLIVGFALKSPDIIMAMDLHVF